MLGDDDMRVIFHSQARFSDLGALELFARMVDVEGSNRGSAPNLPTGVIEGTSTAVPTGQPVTPLVLSPSFAADLPIPGDDLGDGHSFFQLVVAIGSAPVVDDLEPPIIGDESDGEEDTAVVGGAQTHGSSGTQQYPRHFTTLDLEAMNQAANVDQHHPVIHGERPSVIGMDEFEVGQRFEIKEEAVLTIKSYNIRRGVEYKVFESDQLKYHGKCVQFGNGCNWLIRVTMRQRKGYWEVRKCNGPHKCLLTEISMDHRQLDYHVICASIISLVMADISVSVKVLQNAVSSKFGFKPSYRKVWMGKQKAIAQIYGDWEESYNHILMREHLFYLFLVNLYLIY
ncbi:uncharacterized protein LOC130983402 [Arachis stenosperma]|uniref:uncharacterized protein LOC130983402 n=1 Tax=Arachis stenosperma TaxID=217475 RepID=UPI0025AC7A40|nr:uncharacterized protein LOC130983402 [Arachis stenosperma]